MVYNARELTQLHQAGKAFKRPDGSYVPTSTPEEVGTAILQAKQAHRSGSDDDNPAFRQHLIGRAAALGAQRLIPASWAHETSGAKALLAKADRFEAEAARFTDLATARLYFDAAHQLRKQAADMPDAPVSAPGSGSSFPGLDALVRQSAIERSVAKGLAAVIHDGRLAQLERDITRMRSGLASGRLRLAGAYGGPPVMRHRSTRSGELLAKAAEYDRTAGDMTLDRDVRQGYEQLAAKARQEASMA